jgi:hypothetical protein
MNPKQTSCDLTSFTNVGIGYLVSGYIHVIDMSLAAVKIQVKDLFIWVVPTKSENIYQEPEIFNYL